MPVLKTQPVLFCKRCGRPVVASFVANYNTAAGVDMAAIMRAVQENALCEFHEQQRAWYQSQGRGREWDEGNL